MNIHDFTEFCRKAHGKQIRWDGSNYFQNHCLPVAQSCIGSYGKYCPPEYHQYVGSLLNDLYCAALAHDLLEDTHVKVNLLLKMSNERVVRIVKSLTKPDGITYADYIHKLCFEINKETVFALIIKQADLEHNLSTLIGEKHKQRRDKYELASLYIRERLFRE